MLPELPRQLFCNFCGARITKAYFHKGWVLCPECFHEENESEGGQ
jgi:NMD protein affecting ribosome stability and mRNA decay